MIRRVLRSRIARTDSHEVRPLASQQGFTLMEIMVAGLVLTIALIFIAHFFTASAARILTSDTRSNMTQVASQEIETIRSMEYQSVGTEGGQPSGRLAPVEVIESGGNKYLILREVTFFTDPSYVKANPSAPFPANYRRATVKVYLVSNDSNSGELIAGTRVSGAIGPVVMTTNVAGGAQGGTLEMTVTHLTGDGVPGAQLTITNSKLSPQVRINAPSIRTNNAGVLVVPGLPQDTGNNYVVTASKTGFNSAQLNPNIMIKQGDRHKEALVIDRLATLRISVVDETGTPKPDVQLKVTGYQSIPPWTYENTVSTNESGQVVLEGIRYSTYKEPYFIELATPQNPPLRLPDGVDAPPVDSSFIPLAAGKIPVLLDPGADETVTVVVPPPDPVKPVITSVSPSTGSRRVQNTIIITGSGFANATMITTSNNNIKPSGGLILSDSQIQVTMPTYTSNVTVYLYVHNPVGTSDQTNNGRFTYSR
jgi:type II secretory pathway pseudopilin PulG